MDILTWQTGDECRGDVSVSGRAVGDFRGGGGGWLAGEGNMESENQAGQRENGDGIRARRNRDTEEQTVGKRRGSCWDRSSSVRIQN